MKVRGYRADRGYSHKALERLAGAIRPDIVGGSGSLEPLPGVGFFEDLDGKTVPVGGVPVPIETGVVGVLPGKEVARVVYDPAAEVFCMEMAELTYAALERNDGHARFSLLHEFSHLVLHPELLKRMGMLPHHRGLARGADSGHETFRDTEWQADTLAGYLLCPTAGMASLEASGRLDIYSVSQTFQVSHSTARIRIYNYGRHQK